MCGYIGFTNNLKEKEEYSVLTEMMDAIRHRGPDSHGRYIDEKICLGFRRLSIIDLDDGDQPIFNEDKSLVLLFNGEIYNYPILREELLRLGHTFTTKTDSEVLIHGYEEYGSELVKKLRGMFSFVIWDKRQNTLFGARDMFGIKPFYYAKMPGCFIFGSEIKAFLKHPGFKKELNEKALSHFLSFQYSPCEETFFKNVFKLPPAHFFVYKNDELVVERYWKPRFNAAAGTLEEFAEQVNETLRESVEAHKISDVEVGSFLSSGIDSSYITLAAGVQKTFTVGFGEEDKYSEIEHTKTFSKAINVENIAKVITAEEYWSSISKIQYHMDEPLADPSANALYFVSQLASQHVKVALSGEGADELFGGYKIYQEPLTATGYNKIPLPLRRVIGAAASLFPAARGLNFLVRRGKKLESWFIGGANIFSFRERNRLLKTGTRGSAPKVVCRRFYEESARLDSVTRMQHLDIHLWLMGDILLKADKTSMANSLELRVPFLDKQVMRLAETIPTQHRVNSKTTKLVLRKAAEKTLPSFTANKDKLGFPVPIRIWLREDIYYSIVKQAFTSSVAEQFFHTKRLVRMLDIHKIGKKDLSRKIWTVYTFLVWYDEFFVKR